MSLLLALLIILTTYEKNIQRQTRIIGCICNVKVLLPQGCCHRYQPALHNRVVVLPAVGTTSWRRGNPSGIRDHRTLTGFLFTNYDTILR